MKEHLLLTLAVLAVLALGCSETPVSFPLRSLERSGEVSFVCVGPNGEGYDLNACPDFENTENRRHMLALITQTFRGEVAIVDLSAGKVVDLDQSTPGYGFVPVGEIPVDIVSTPGGVASFVAVAEVGQPGIYAIPSTCAKPPAHDLVTWPACALDAPPGEMAILVDPAADDGGVRASCDGDYSLDAATPGVAPAATRADCAADLALETVSPGRRKLLVTLPTLGQYVIIDAQQLLDRQPGSFDACPIERRVELMDELPASTKLVQKIPADLQTSCGITELEYGPPQPGNSFPAGIDVSDGRLFIADKGNPLVHVVDVHDPCSPIEQPPFVALSYDAPNRPDIFTTHVAVSPPTTDGSRFAYAVDQDGSTMIFDATPGHSDRTPIVRSGSPRLPFEPPDRIRFEGNPARGVTFALRDVPAADPATGVASIGTYCDPDPNAVGPSTLYRPNSAYSSGARAHNLRGVFGFIMLASGQVAVIDVEDFDAACRRPREANSSSELDFRGCSGDPQTVVDGGGYVVGAEKRRTVTDELSCRMVEQHRARSGRVMINSNEFGVNAPSLRNFPRLSQENSSVGTSNSNDAQVNPKLLAVDFPDPANPPDGVLPAEVFIGVNRYRSGELENPLDTSPQTAERASIALLLQEPRAFFGDEDLRLVYEGEIVKGRIGRFDVSPAGGSTLVDFDGGFCDRGIEGVPRMRERGTILGVEAANLEAFAREHADYVQITSELHGKDDSYWNDLPANCEAQGKAAFFACRDLFGAETEVFKELRDFVVLDAHQGDLVVEPRRYANEAERQKILEDFGCCFGGTKLRYSVRAGSHWVLTGNAGIQHNIIADPTADNQCIRDCNPRNQFLNGRAFEIAASGTCSPTPDLPCAVGPATGTDAPACIQTGQGQVAASSACVFQSLTHRFAVYRGTDKDGSKRDMTFSWSVTGGFSPLTASLTSQTRAVSPQSIVFVPQLGQLAVADGAAAGLVLISLDSVAPSQLFF